MTVIPPKLIEPIDVLIESLDKTKTRYSSGRAGRREKKNRTVYKTAVSVPAQVVFTNEEQKTKFNTLGADERSKGYLVVRFIDLQALGIDLKRGDRIKDLTKDPLYLLHSTNKPAAQFSSLGTFSIARVFFGDRKPIK